jgi:HNH endonuclease
MSIYTPTNYRLIYEQTYGPIPVDSEGKTYDIHHLDGNRENNDPSNLIALSVEEHYKIHYDQGDWGACLALSVRMKMSPEQISEMVGKQQRERVANGTHHFLDSEWQRKAQNKRMERGNHPFLDSKWQSQMSIRTQMKRVSAGTHHFQNQPKVECPHCGKTGANGIMHRFHFDKCKYKSG